MRSPTCQRATIAVYLLLSAAPGCCARLVAPPNWRGQLRYAVPSVAGCVLAYQASRLEGADAHGPAGGRLSPTAVHYYTGPGPVRGRHLGLPALEARGLSRYFRHGRRGHYHVPGVCGRGGGTTGDHSH